MQESGAVSPGLPDKLIIVREILPFASLSPDMSPKGLLFPPEKKKKKNVSINRDCNEEARWYCAAVAVGMASMNIGG